MDPTHGKEGPSNVQILPSRGGAYCPMTLLFLVSIWVAQPIEQDEM
jgi:hypothetical protein